MAKVDCVKAIKASVKDKSITDAQAKTLMARMKNLAKQRRFDKNIDLQEALRQIAGEEILKANKKKEVELRNRLLNYDRYLVRTEQAKNHPIWAEGIKAMNWSTEKKRTAGGISSDSISGFLEHAAWSRLAGTLKKLGVYREAKRAHFEHEVWMELNELGIENGQPGKWNPVAAKIAASMRPILRELSARELRAGAFYHAMEDYNFMQTHNVYELRKLGIDKDGKFNMSLGAERWWNEHLKDRVNWEKTFEGNDPSIMVRHMYEGLVTRHHGSPAEEYEFEAFRSHGGSLANKISSERVIWFKDAESAYQYNKELGNSANYMEAFRNEVRRRSKNIALLETWGPGGKDNYLKIINKLLDDTRNLETGADKQSDALHSSHLERIYDFVAGHTDRPENPTWAAMTSWGQFLGMTAHLGKVWFTSWTDVPMTLTDAHHQGMGYLDAFGRHLRYLLESSEDKMRIAQGLGQFTNSFSGSYTHRFTEMTRSTRGASSLINNFMDLNFLNQHTDHVTAGYASVLAGNAADNAHLKFKELPPDLSRVMDHYGIGSKEWDVIRKNVTKVGDYNYILTDTFDQVPQADIDGLIVASGKKVTPANQLRARADLQTKWGIYINDRVHAGVPTPQASERYVMTWGGQQAGTPIGFLARMVMMFKSFPYTVLHRVVGREIYGRGNESIGQWLFHDGKGLFNVAQIVAMTTVAGYITMTVKDFLAGRTARELVTDGKPNFDVMMQAMQTGGGMGILGDYLFSEYDRQYRTMSGTLFGPIFGQLDPMMALKSKLTGMAIGEERPGMTPESAGMDAFNLLLQNTPYLNLFYIRPVLDYLVFWNIKEMLSPGVLRRSERSIREHNHQDFYITPSEVYNRF